MQFLGYRLSNGLPFPIGPLSICLSVCLSVTLVYCGQTVGWLKMQLCMEVGLGPGGIVLDGDPVPSQTGAQQSPTFLAHVCRF